MAWEQEIERLMTGKEVKLFCIFMLLIALPFGMAQMPGALSAQLFPWSDAKLSPDACADMVVKQMTLDEKISLLHGQGMPMGATARN